MGEGLVLPLLFYLGGTMSTINFKNAKDFEKDFDKVHHDLWDNNYEQRRIIESLGYKITFRLLFGLYYMINKFDYSSGPDTFEYCVFKKFMDRDTDAPYEKFMGKLSATDGISLFIKACLATEGQPGYAPIAYKLMVDYEYRDKVEEFSRTSISRANSLGAIEGALDLCKDFLGVTSPDIARLHRVMCPIDKYEYPTREAFLIDYNKIGGEDVS
jgi:hypothetical protein